MPPASPVVIDYSEKLCIDAYNIRVRVSKLGRKGFVVHNALPAASAEYEIRKWWVNA
ncbi:MAG: hypothetical protein KDB22_21720 [Planctomycetales bacterium]|nr:hypothetical protein [Planctomycetales bacterium]